MRQPITFVYGNLVFGAGGVDDPWALYRLATRSYAGLTTSHKRALLGELAGFAYSIGADFQLMRVTRTRSAEDFARQVRALADEDRQDEDLLDRLVEAERRQVEMLASSSCEVFLAVALRPPAKSGPLADVSRLLGLKDPRGLTRKALAALTQEETRIFARASDYLVTSVEVV